MNKNSRGPGGVSRYFDSAIRPTFRNLAGQTERFIELLKDAAERQTVRCTIRVVILEQCEAHHEIREPLAAVRVRDVLHIGDQALNVQELRHGSHLFRILIDHDGRADAAVRVAAA